MYASQSPRASRWSTQTTFAVQSGLRVRGLLLRRRLSAEVSRGKGRAVGLAVLGLGFAIFVFVVALAGALYVRHKAAPELLSSGAAAALTGLSAALVFSSLGHAAQAFFTAKDLWLWDSAPTGTLARFLDRLGETGLAALPAVTAVGTVGLWGWTLGGGLGVGGIVRATVAMALTVLWPLSLGIVLAHLGGAVLPAGRLRRASLLVLGVFVAAALVWFRRARVERLLTADGAHALLVSAREASGLGPSWSPFRAMATFVVDGDVRGFFQGLLLTGACVACALVAHAGLYDRARKLAVDESPTGVLQGSLAARALERVVGIVPRDLRPLVRKDLLAFVRDPGQWGQVILLVGVGVLYVVNASALGEGMAPLGEFGDVVLVAAHTGIVGFIAGGLAARFAFPQVGLEGPAVWIVDGAPLSERRLLWAKFLAAQPVAVLYPLLLAVVSGLVLAIPPPLFVFATSLLAVLSVLIAAAATFRGALHPLFDATSLSELAIGPGAMSTMFVTTGLAFCGSVGAFLGGLGWLGLQTSRSSPVMVVVVVFVGVVWALPLVIGLWFARDAFRRGEGALRRRREGVSAGPTTTPSSSPSDGHRLEAFE
jgi:hypothetical protein